MLNKFNSVINNIENLISQSNALISGDNIQENENKALMLCLSLRSYHRNIFNDLNNQLECSKEKKQKVEKLKLQYESLKYHFNHLQKEIDVCKAKKTYCEEVPVISSDEFSKLAPDNLQTDSQDNHKYTLNRLAYELYQRKELKNKLSEIQLLKENIEESVKDRKNFLISIKSYLDKVLQGVQPLQQHLVSLDSSPTHNIAKLLPTPLYILYYCLHVYISTYDSSLILELGYFNKNTHHIETINRETLELGEVSLLASKFGEQFGPNKIDQLIDEETVFPLIVILKMHGANGKELIINFYYISSYKILTVNCNDFNMLDNLFHDDVGNILPRYFTVNPEPWPPQHTLEFISDNDRGILSFVGKPYRWVQGLGGLHCLSPQDPDYIPPNINQVMEKLIKILQNR